MTDHKTIEPAWTCDDRGPHGECRNPHGCHCDEIAGLVRERNALRFWLTKLAGWNEKQIADAIQSAHANR